MAFLVGGRLGSWPSGPRKVAILIRSLINGLSNMAAATDLWIGLIFYLQSMVVNHTHSCQKQLSIKNGLISFYRVISCMLVCFQSAHAESNCNYPMGSIIDIIRESGPQCLSFDRYFMQIWASINQQKYKKCHKLHKLHSHRIYLKW